jgi:hypothetical protein
MSFRRRALDLPSVRIEERFIERIYRLYEQGVDELRIESALVPMGQGWTEGRG